MTSRKWAQVCGRKAERYAKVGKEMENVVTEFLKNSVDQNGSKIFASVYRHKQGSLADHHGKDITVVRVIGGKVEERSFGITISQRRYNLTKNKHEPPVFLTPPDFNRERLLLNVLSLFNKSKAATP